MAKTKLILASASPRRVDLLKQIAITPDLIEPADLDETPAVRETPRLLAGRLARQKAEAVLTKPHIKTDWQDALVLAADTVVAAGRRILPKAETEAEAITCLDLLSGRNHRVFTGLCVGSVADGSISLRVIETRVTFKHLSKTEKQAYLASGEWHGKAGAYAVQGLAASFVSRVLGSYSAVVGLPLHETAALLAGRDFPVFAEWEKHSE